MGFMCEEPPGPPQFFQDAKLKYQQQMIERERERSCPSGNKKTSKTEINNKSIAHGVGCAAEVNGNSVQATNAANVDDYYLLDTMTAFETTEYPAVPGDAKT